MAKKPPTVSYAGLSLGTEPAAATTALSPEPTEVRGRRVPKAEGRTLKESSAHLMLYLHPTAAKALKRYALDQNVKVHDLLIEALENWFRAHGLKEPVRAETTVRRNPR